MPESKKEETQQYSWKVWNVVNVIYLLWKIPCDIAKEEERYYFVASNKIRTFRCVPYNLQTFMIFTCEFRCHIHSFNIIFVTLSYGCEMGRDKTLLKAISTIINSSLASVKTPVRVASSTWPRIKCRKHKRWLGALIYRNTRWEVKIHANLMASVLSYTVKCLRIISSSRRRRIAEFL